MSASAKFLLEFQATGDQEVVNKIREVGAAGQQAATDLQDLQGIEDPFSAVGEGAERAIGPITEVGSATEELGGVFSDAGSASEDFGGALTGMNGEVEGIAGGLTEANTVVGEFGGSAEAAAGSATTMGESTQGAIGAFVGLGGALGSATSLAFRMQDAQLRLDKAQLKAAKSTESARKAQVAFNNLLGTATKNTDGIAMANERLSAAQAHLNGLIDAGVTSGPEYAAAQQEVADATAALKQEFIEGGGSAEKFDSAMAKMKNSNEAMELSLKALEKIQRETTQQWYELPFAIAGVTGTMIQSISSMGKFLPLLKAMKVGAIDLSNALKIMTGVGLGGFTLALAAGGAAVAVFMGAVIALNKAPYDSIIGKLDELGKTIGKTFPAAATALTSLGDAAGTSLDFLAGYSRGLVKQLTGVELQTDVTKKSFSELVQIFLKDGTTGYTQINRAIGGYVDAARAQGLSDKEIIELAKKHNDENKNVVQSTDKLTESSTEYGKAADSNMVSVEGVRTAIAYLPGSIDPANKSLVEMGTELGTAAEQMQLVEGGVMSLNAELHNNIDANALEARALLEVRDAALQNEEAISANHLAYAQSVDKLKDLNAVLENSQAAHEAVQTEVNNTAVALGEESIQLEAASQSADNLQQKQARLDNAFKSGVVSIKEWANGLAEAKREQEGQVSELVKMGAKWSDIPPFVERNIETLQLFGVAAKEGGEAGREAAEMASEAWRDATSEMGSELQGLADIFMKGGDDMKESTDKWFEDMEGKIGREMTGAESAASEGIANMIASTEQAVNDWQFGQLLGETIEQGAADMASAFENLATTAEGGMKNVFNKAAEILRSDAGPALSDEINEIMKGVGTTAPAALLEELNKLLPSGVKDAATKAGETLPGSLDPAAGQAGQSAALTLSQEFAAAGTHIRSVIDGIKKNLASIGAKGAAKGINMGIYYRYYIIGKPPQPKPFNLGIYYRYYIVNARPNPPHLQRGIYYRYYTIGKPPNPPNLQRTIKYVYKTVGTRPAQTGMHENLSQDTLIAAHRGERVDITPGTVNSNENRTAIIPASGTNNRPINITVRGDVNGKELIRFVKFNLMENTGGVM